ncbi:MAG: acyl-ACP--UDP-N-acetylglucosamine O-acyltransferase [Cocleimonas sp.]
MSIHPTAIIDSKAEIANDVVISPYSVIGPNVKIDSGSWIGPHVVIEGPTTIGKDNKIFQFASVGAEPQDKKYKGEPTTLTIGDRNVIRESCTINRGTSQDIGTTSIGDDNWIMAYVHIAHDCVVGNNTIFANNATLAGHVTIHNNAILGGFTLVHQFCHVGEYSFTGMGTALAKDLPPYVMAFGAPGIPRGVNSEGLKRHGFTEEERKQIKNAYKTLYRKKMSLDEAVEELLESDNKKVKLMAEFCKKSQAGRGVIR